MDHFVRGFIDSVAWGLHGVSRGWRLDSLVTRLRSDFLDPSFCNGEKNCIVPWPADRSPFHAGAFEILHPIRGCGM
jgi:hypothetical protein